MKKTFFLFSLLSFCFLLSLKSQEITLNPFPQAIKYSSEKRITIPYSYKFIHDASCDSVSVSRLLSVLKNVEGAEKKQSFKITMGVTNDKLTVRRRDARLNCHPLFIPKKFGGDSK